MPVKQLSKTLVQLQANEDGLTAYEAATRYGNFKFQSRLSELRKHWVIESVETPKKTLRYFLRGRRTV